MWVWVLIYALILSGRISTLQKRVRDLERVVYGHLEDDPDTEIEYDKPTDWFSILTWVVLIGIGLWIGLNMLGVIDGQI